MRVKDKAKIGAIFKSTIVLTGTVGIAGLKISTIAKKANLASGTLYLYFENKEQLLNALYVFLKKEALKKTYIDSDGLSIEEKLRLLWEKTIRYRIAHQAELVFMEQFLISPYVTEESRKVGQDFYSLIADTLDDGKKKKQIKNLDNSVLIPLLSGYLRDLTLPLAPKNTSLDKIIKQSFTVCWHAIRVS